MSHEVRGVVSVAKGEAVRVETVLVPDPGPGEALVQVQACGVCHTDLHYREGGINNDFPFLLGHEAAGTVEAVGSGVTSVAPGDYVILNWRAVCGQCRSCKKGDPAHCFNTCNAKQKMTLKDGTELSPALGIGAFAEKTLVAAGQCTKVNPAARPEAAGLLGCGVMAGLGAAMFTGEVKHGDSVAVFGCGGVGLNVIQGAAIAGAERIIAIDTMEAKLEMAKKFGATDVLLSKPGEDTGEDTAKALKKMTGGGPDYAFECVGNGELAGTAYKSIRRGGMAVVVGVAKAGDSTSVRTMTLPFEEKTLTGSYFGSCVPRIDFPRMLALYARGTLKLDELITRRYSIEQAPEAFADLESGKNARGVIVF